MICFAGQSAKLQFRLFQRQEIPHTGNPYLGKAFHPFTRWGLAALTSQQNTAVPALRLRGHPLKLLQTKKLPHTTFLVIVCNSFSVKWTKRKRPTCYGWSPSACSLCVFFSALLSRLYYERFAIIQCFARCNKHGIAQKSRSKGPKSP